tara:strand:+ start:164 stop:439 length:276 start_codon:yes stop_codon:yes gene_type:complete
VKKRINPLNVFEARRVSFCPPHFEIITIEKTYNIDTAMSEWINENCKGRFFIGPTVELNSDNKIVTKLKIGFENSKEMSYFMLACPLLKYK